MTIKQLDGKAATVPYHLIMDILGGDYKVTVILGNDETCCGDPARRLGNEYIFQMLAKQNIERFNELNVKKVVTICPHCYNTIKNEYPQLGAKYEVWHHSEFIASLLRNGS
jgi:Fe-S oxidoreductase